LLLALPGEAGSQAGKVDDIRSFLEPFRAKSEFPALAAVVLRGEAIVAQGAVGLRKIDGKEPVTADDKFHIGSITKSMTATLAAMLVEQGKLAWKTKIVEVLPELKTSMDPAYKDVTLEQLLGHRGGAPNQADPAAWSEAWRLQGTPTEQRLNFVRATLSKPPEAPPGQKFVYSNQGYAVAGAMIEKVTGKAWEDLMRQLLFQPLGMATAGFGPPSAEGKVDQPWGHKKEGGTLKAFRADNPPAIGPGGTVHCSLSDLAKYAAFHIKGESGRSRGLKAEGFRKLHAPLPGQQYALGWFAVPWNAETALNHSGSNTMFYVLIWVWPASRTAIIVATNAGGDGVDPAVAEVHAALTKKYVR
jgi:CubicO group peptidase (beta-lactamase class C family)